MGLAMKQIILMAFALAGGCAFGTPARADYAVLKSGVRLHITGYEKSGDQIRLTVTGGMRTARMASQALEEATR